MLSAGITTRVATARVIPPEVPGERLAEPEGVASGGRLGRDGDPEATSAVGEGLGCTVGEK